MAVVLLLFSVLFITRQFKKKIYGVLRVLMCAFGTVKYTNFDFRLNVMKPLIEAYLYKILDSDKT